jgi:hypothetical protein
MGSLATERAWCQGTNAITSFRVLQHTQQHLVIEVNYSYSGDFGNNVWIGALPVMNQQRNGYFSYYAGGPLLVGRGQTVITIAPQNRLIPRGFTTNQIMFDMYYVDPKPTGPPHRIFLTAILPFNKIWGN